MHMHRTFVPQAFNRRRFAQGLLAMAMGQATASQAQPLLQSLRIVCADAQGQPADTLGRRLAERLGGGRLAWDVLVINSPGHAGRQAVDLTRHARADGSVLLVAPSSAITVLPHLRDTPARSPFEELAPVAPLATFHYALIAGPAIPTSVDNVARLVSWHRSAQGPLRCGVVGAATTEQMLARLLRRQLSAHVNCVSLSDGVAVATAAARGSVEIAICPEGALQPRVERGHVRVLATTRARRSALYPASATFAEQGLPALTHTGRLMAFVPATTLHARRSTLQGAIARALRDAEMKPALERVAADRDDSSLEQIEIAMRREFQIWGRLASP